jgi:hypothetical protein
MLALMVGGVLFAARFWSTWFPPPTPEQAAAQAAKQAAEAAAETARWDAEATKQPAREVLIAKLIEQGIFQGVEYTGSRAFVWVGAEFYLQDFSAKQDFCSVVYAYMAGRERSELVSVKLRDTRTGKDIGEFSQTLSGLKLTLH